MQAAVGAAHVVVIDGDAAPHIATLATAYALGRPVLVRDSALTRDFVGAGADGWFVPAGADAAVWADAMAAVLKRPDLLPGMARAAGLKAARRLGREHAEKTLFATLGLVDLRAIAA